MDAASLPSVLKTISLSHLSVGAAGVAVGAYFKAELVIVLRALPNYLVTRAKARFDADVKAGKISPPIARLAVVLKRAVFFWADQELPQALGDEKMAMVLHGLENLPYVGALVRADPEGIEADLQAEYEAMRAEVKKQADAQKPTP